MANKRNDAIYRAKTAYQDQLRYARVLQKGGMLMSAADKDGHLWIWADNNGYEVRIRDGKIEKAAQA